MTTADTRLNHDLRITLDTWLLDPVPESYYSSTTTPTLIKYEITLEVQLDNDGRVREIHLSQ